MKLWLPLLLSIFILSGVIFSCKKSSNSPIPFLKFIALSPDSIKMLSKDTTFLTFHFSDGDGDLGHDPSSGNYDVFLKDMRDDRIDTLKFFFPPIPDGAIDPIDGITGDGAVALQSSRIVIRQDSVHTFRDTVIYKMWIVDKAQHWSNEIKTTPLYLHR